MSYSDPKSADDGAIFAEPAHLDEATRRRRLVPVLALAVPMIAAYLAFFLSPEGMNAWAVSGPRLAQGEYQTILLHMFAHGGLMHIGFNMMALFAIGPAVMERLGSLSLRTVAGLLALFFLTGLAGMGAWLAINPQSPIPMLGASGAIFGLLGAILRQPDPLASPIPLFSRAMGNAFLTFGKLHLPLIALFAIPLLFGSGFFGLAWEAHLGGFVAGILLGGGISRWCGDGGG